MARVPDKIIDVRHKLNCRYGHSVTHAEHIAHPALYAFLFAGWHEAYVWAGGAVVLLWITHALLSGDDE